MSLFKRKKKGPYGWFGDYQNWESLTALSGGYEANAILEKTKEALLKVRRGEAVYERDSVLFDQKIYPYSLITALLYAAVESENKLHVLDFGGSLGSTYYQVRDLIPPAVQLQWTVVEQDNFVRCGKASFEDDILKFHYTIEESQAAGPANVLLLSSVVQYLEKPHEFLDAIQQHAFPYILIDRTAFLHGDRRDRLTLQIVPPHIYEARYPAWFFNEKAFLAHFRDYDVKMEFESFVPGEQEMEIDHEKVGYDKGFFLIRK